MFKYNSATHFRTLRKQLSWCHLFRYLQILEIDSNLNAHCDEKLNFKVKISDLNNSLKNVANNEGQSDAELDKHHAMVRQLRRLNKTLIIERFDLQEQY